MASCSLSVGPARSGECQNSTGFLMFLFFFSQWPHFHCGLSLIFRVHTVPQSVSSSKIPTETWPKRSLTEVFSHILFNKYILQHFFICFYSTISFLSILPSLLLLTYLNYPFFLEVPFWQSCLFAFGHVSILARTICMALVLAVSTGTWQAQH